MTILKIFTYDGVNHHSWSPLSPMIVFLHLNTQNQKMYKEEVCILLLEATLDWLKCGLKSKCRVQLPLYALKSIDPLLVEIDLLMTKLGRIKNQNPLMKPTVIYSKINKQMKRHKE